MKTPTEQPPSTAVPSSPTPNSWQHVNRLQLAQLLGVHIDTVSDYARVGMPIVTKGGPGKEGIYDAVECLAWWRSSRGQDAKEAAQARAYDATARLNELKLETQGGKLVAIDDVILAGQHYTRAWTAKLRALPRQMVQSGVLSRDQEPVAAAMLRQLLEDISRWRTVKDTLLATRKTATTSPRPVNGGRHGAAAIAS